jgi:hypothetical protein
MVAGSLSKPPNISDDRSSRSIRLRVTPLREVNGSPLTPEGRKPLASSAWQNFFVALDRIAGLKQS